MSYLRSPLGFQPGLYGGHGQDIAAGLPGPGSPMMPAGLPVSAMPASLFPTSVKWGDVVTVGGSFAGKIQGQVLVRFAGVPAQAVYLTSGYGGTVVVPEGARSGACTIEVDGRTVYGGNCVISSGISGPRPPARAPQHRGARAWRNVGDGSPLGGSMSYINDGTAYTRGPNAIAADTRRVRRRTTLVAPGLLVARTTRVGRRDFPMVSPMGDEAVLQAERMSPGFRVMYPPPVTAPYAVPPASSMSPTNPGVLYPPPPRHTGGIASVSPGGQIATTTTATPAPPAAAGGSRLGTIAVIGAIAAAAIYALTA